jgi:hypothetical protein
MDVITRGVGTAPAHSVCKDMLLADVAGAICPLCDISCLSILLVDRLFCPCTRAEQRHGKWKTHASCVHSRALPPQVAQAADLPGHAGAAARGGGWVLPQVALPTPGHCRTQDSGSLPGRPIRSPQTAHKRPTYLPTLSPPWRRQELTYLPTVPTLGEAGSVIAARSARPARPENFLAF